MNNILQYRKWFVWGILNLSIVALFGVVMRYKIAYDFPFFSQKNLLHAHSHFAFSGWVSHMLYMALALVLSLRLKNVNQRKYTYLFIFNLVCAFGMLFAFTAQGYKAVSITFSTLSIVLAVVYAVYFIRDSRALSAKEHPFKLWAIAGLLLNIISAVGPFTLAYLMSSKQRITPDLYLGLIYYFLHFQYNGWFFFGSMALAVSMLPKGFPDVSKYFWIFAITSVPTVLLSMLWLKLPMWLYVVTVITTFLQMFAWVALVVKCYPLLRHLKHETKPVWVNLFLYSAVIALSIKFLLQTVSVIPSLSHLVFGFRSIVIAYLHLDRKSVFSLFLIGYSFFNNYLQPTKTARVAAFGFFTGVLLNELLLGVQGMASFTYTPVPHINGLLLFAALVLFFSAVMLFASQLKKAQS